MIPRDELFSTSNDVENRSAVRAVPTDRLQLAGTALYGARKPMERILRGLSLYGSRA